MPDKISLMTEQAVPNMQGVSYEGIPVEKINFNGPVDMGTNIIYAYLSDTNRIVDANNVKKQFRFDCVSLTAGTLRTYTVPDASGTLALTSDISAVISDTAYASSWNGVTTIAPSKNAVYDKIETLQPLDAGLTSLAGLAYSATAFVKMTAADTFSLDTAAYQPLDSDLTTIAGLTATTDNFIVSVANAWASRTPAEVKTTLSLNNVENTALSTWAGSTNITTIGTLGVNLTQTKATSISNVFTITGGSNVVTDYLADGEHYRTAVVYKQGALGYGVTCANAVNNAIQTPAFAFSNANNAISVRMVRSLTYKAADYHTLLSERGANTHLVMLWYCASTTTGYVNLYYYSSTAGNSSVTFSTVNMTYGTAYQIGFAVDYTAKTASMYLNGALVQTKALTNPVFPSTSGIKYLTEHSTPYRFIGTDDEYCIWNTLKDDAFFLADYNSGNFTYTTVTTGLEFGYHMDEGTGTGAVLVDISGNSRTGTIGSACTWSAGFVSIPGADVTRNVFRVIDGVSASEAGKFYFGDSVNNDSSYYIGLTKIPGTTTINQLLYSSAANVVTGLATGNSSVLVTSAAGVPSLATDIPTAVTIGTAYIYRVGGTDVPLTDGGTGASTATDARTNLGLVIGTDVQAYNASTTILGNSTTGTGAIVRETNPTIVSPALNSPTLTTPILGTPQSGTLTNCTGLPIAGGGTGGATAAAALTNLGLGAYFCVSQTTAKDMAAKNTWYDYSWSDRDATVKTGFTHSKDTNPEQITVTAAGTYEFTYTIQCHNASAWTGYCARILDDGVEIPDSWISGIFYYGGALTKKTIAFIAAGSVIELQVGTNINGSDIAYYDDADFPNPTTFNSAIITIVRLASAVA